MMGKAGAGTAELPLHRVDVVEQGIVARQDRIRCEIGKNLEFDTAGLGDYCSANWDKRVFDAFVLAAAVQFCDHTKRRPSIRWGREIDLRVPVHDPTHWRSAKVSETLHDALGFLTGDRWHLEFVERHKPESDIQKGKLDLLDNEGVIIAFSDGLDSRAVAGLAEREHGNKLIRVRLGFRSPDRWLPKSRRIPLCGKCLTVCAIAAGALWKTSARSRGFTFALLSGIAAYLSHSPLVIVPESGQGVLGPVLVSVGQAYEDYRNHPFFTDRMKAFLLALFGHEVCYTYPRLWSTKAETVAEFIAACPDDDSWTQTRSCWQGQRQASVSGRWRQCGICAACMLRRMSVHAIGGTEDKKDLCLGRFERRAVRRWCRRRIQKSRTARYYV